MPPRSPTAAEATRLTGLIAPTAPFIAETGRPPLGTGAGSAKWDRVIALRRKESRATSAPGVTAFAQEQSRCERQRTRPLLVRSGHADRRWSRARFERIGGRVPMPHRPCFPVRPPRALRAWSGRAAHGRPGCASGNAWLRTPKVALALLARCATKPCLGVGAASCEAARRCLRESLAVRHDEEPLVRLLALTLLEPGLPPRLRVVTHHQHPLVRDRTHIERRAIRGTAQASIAATARHAAPTGAACRRPQAGLHRGPVHYRRRQSGPRRHGRMAASTRVDVGWRQPGTRWRSTHRRSRHRVERHPAGARDDQKRAALRARSEHATDVVGADADARQPDLHLDFRASSQTHPPRLSPGLSHRGRRAAPSRMLQRSPPPGAASRADRSRPYCRASRRCP